MHKLIVYIYLCVLNYDHRKLNVPYFFSKIRIYTCWSVVRKFKEAYQEKEINLKHQLECVSWYIKHKFYKCRLMLCIQRKCNINVVTRQKMSNKRFFQRFLSMYVILANQYRVLTVLRLDDSLFLKIFTETCTENGLL